MRMQIVAVAAIAAGGWAFGQPATAQDATAVRVGTLSATKQPINPAKAGAPVFGTGAAMPARRHVSTPVFGGRLAASLIGIFAIPALYVIFQGLRERVKVLAGRRPQHPSHDDRSET